MQQFILGEIKKLSSLLLQLQQDHHLFKMIEDIVNQCTTALMQGKKMLFIGNGGSAADAQHLAAELVNRLGYNRPALAAIALTTDTSTLTAIGNDDAFEHIFSRQIESIGQEGDVLIAITTSGRSRNVLRAIEAAKRKRMVTVGFTGKEAPIMAEQCDFMVYVPTQATQKIQECHILIGHIICELIENKLFGAEYNPLYQDVTKAAV